MAQYFTNFSEYTAEAAPSDWTPRFVTSGVTYTVENDGGATGGKVLRAVRSSSGRSMLSWDAVDSDSGRVNLEILTRLRTTEANDGSASVGGVAGRGSGSAASESIYVGTPLRTSAGTAIRQTGKYVSGTFSSIALENAAWNSNTFYWTRFRVNGSTVMMKRWAGEIGNEPGSWQLSNFDASLTSAGWIGAFIFSATTIDFDLFSVGTDGDTAPSSDPGGGGASLQREHTDVVKATDSSSQASVIKRTIRRTL